MSKAIKRHPLAIKWDEWLASKEGEECRQANTLAHNTNTYLENRLRRAFDAGVKAREEVEAMANAELYDLNRRTA